ncbi:dynein regulatory complex subunit 4-like [Clarias gariepinus]
MTKEQLEEKIKQMHAQMEQEVKDRNYFQLEKDKIQSFCEMTKKQLEEKKTDLRNRDKDLEADAERHQAKTMMYDQKLRHLLQEQQTTIGELKTERVVITKVMEAEHTEVESKLQRDRLKLKANINEQELSYLNLIKNLKLNHNKETTKLRTKFEDKVREIEATYEKKMQIQRAEQDLRRKNELHETEQKKNFHISMLIKNHEKAFSDFKSYYSEITLGSFNQINLLKDQRAEMKMKEEAADKEMTTVLKENQHLIETLQEVTQEVSDLQKELTDYHKDKALLKEKKADLKARDAELKDQKLENEVMKQRIIMMQQKHDVLHQKFSKAIQEVHQKNSFKNLLLERKLTTLTDTVEKKGEQSNASLKWKW